jgi:hypothetical protein
MRPLAFSRLTMAESTTRAAGSGGVSTINFAPRQFVTRQSNSVAANSDRL